MSTKIEQLKEYARIIKDTPYALKTYLQTYDNTQSRYVPFDLFPDQITLVNDYENYNENITRKYRQAGVTTVTAAWISKKLQTAKPEKPEKVLIVANKRDTAIEMANKIRGFLDQWPDWINVGYSQSKNSETRFRLNNGCEVKAVATSRDALRGYTPTILIFDEAAYIEAGEDFWAASMASLSTGGKVILISCVTKDTYVFTPEGPRQISTFIDESKSSHNGYFINNYSILGKNKFRTSNIMMNNGVQKTLKIHTVNSIIEGTETHKLWAYSNKHQKYDWFPLKDLRINDYVNINYGFEKWGNNDDVDFNYIPSSKESNIFYTSKITPDIAYIMGLYISEGSSYLKFNKNKNLIGCNITLTCGDDLHESIENIGLSYCSHDNLHYTISSKSFYSFLEKLGFNLQLKASEKIIPDRLLNMSRENMIAMMQGIFDGDGWSDQKRGRIGINLSSKKLIDQIRMILLNFGILTDYQYIRMKPTKKVKVFSDNYRISCNSIYSKIFFQKIGFRFERKQIKSDALLKYIENHSDSFDVIPGSSQIIKDILVENSIKRKDLNFETKKIYDQLNKVDSLSRRSFSLFIEFLINKNIKISDHIFDKIFFNNSKWIKIKEIEESSNETYDFSLYNDSDDFWCHSIFYNGLLGHQTPNGFDPIYYGIYEQAVRGANNFHITELKWYNDPRYAKEVKWIKCKDIVHYMLNREEYNDEEITVIEHDRNKFDELIQEGYKPYSTWFENMAKKFKYDKRKINQEIEAAFLGSGDNVIPPELIEKILKEQVRDPKEKYMMGQMWQWKDPIQGHRYILGCLPPGETVLTDDGLLSVENVDIKHRLVDENGNYAKIINKQIYNVVDEDIYEIGVDNTFRTTKFTKEHPILISSSKLKRNWKRHDPNIEFKKRFWDFEFSYKKVSEALINDWIKVPNIYKKDLEININDKWNNDINVRNDFLIDSPLSNKEFWWFMGLWLGDGWIGKNKYSYSITICFNKKEYYYLEKCKEVIKLLFNRYPSIVEREKTFDLTFNSKELYYFILENFGQYSYGKKISEWVKFIPNEFKKEIVKGYFDSDGCWLKTTKNKKINSKISFTSINLELLEGIQDILFSLGIISCLNKLRDASNNHEICGKLSETKITYSLNLANYDSLQLIELLNDINDIKLNKFKITEFTNINNRIISSCHFDDTKDFIYFRIKKICKSKYSGNVYNFETESHTFMSHHITTHNCDVSRGDSEDYSAINIIDFDDREQVLEYIGKIPPDDLASIAYKWGTIYQAFIVIDITGGMGIATARKLQEMNYKNLFIDGINTQNIWEYDTKMMEKIPGISFNNKRTQIVAAFEEQIRHGFLIRSVRLTNEMNTFVFLNGKPDHMKGTHDDSIMSIAMAMYAGDISFTQLVRNELQNKAMIDSWMLSERTYEPNKSFYSYGQAFDPLGAIDSETGKPIPNPLFSNETLLSRKEMYQKYSWLFGKGK